MSPDSWHDDEQLARATFLDRSTGTPRMGAVVEQRAQLDVLVLGGDVFGQMIPSHTDPSYEW